MAKMTRSNRKNKPLKIVADHQLMDSTRDEFYEKEKSQVFKQIRNMIDKLMIEKEHLKHCDSIQEDEMNSLAASVKPLHKVITKFQMLIKSERSHLELLPDNMTVMERIKTELLLNDLRSSTQLLKSKVVAHGIAPYYRLLSKSTSGKYFVYKYSCSLFGDVRRREWLRQVREAGEDTATNMLRLILKKQKNLSLSSHIRPIIGVKELKDIGHIMKSAENYVRQLEKICAENECSAPTYELLSYTCKDKIGRRYSIQ